MKARIGVSLCGLSLLILALAAAWASREEAAPPYAWTLDEPVRIISDFPPQGELDVSFRLCNTALVPRRILGAAAC